MTRPVTTRLRLPGPPQAQAAPAVWIITTNASGETLLGRHRTDSVDLPGRKVEAGESLDGAAARELGEATSLSTETDDIHIFALLLDAVEGTTRLTVGAADTRFTGHPAVQPGEAHTARAWHAPSAPPAGLFVPRGQLLRARQPDLPILHPPTEHYRQQHVGPLTPGKGAV